MSTEKRVPQSPSAGFTKANVKIDDAVEKKQPAVEKIEISALQIDESYDVDCDPYNSTGQFLTDALKKKYGE